MPTSTGPVKVAAVVPALTLALLTLTVWMLRGYVWPELSNVEVDVLRAMLDPSLFRHDFSVQASLGFTPRYYYNALILAPARAGLPMEWVFALWQLVTIATLLSALRNLARTLGLGEVAGAILVVWVLTVSVGTLGGVFFYTHAPVPAVWAGALVAWGVAHAWQGRWTAAYTCFGLASLLQFLVGFYAGVLALPALLWTCQRNILPPLIPWLLGLALVYVPMRLTGGTGTNVMDDATFVGIYAQVRLPHHLVPSAWGWTVWLQAIAFYFGAWCLLHRTRANRPAGEQIMLLVTLGMAAAALGLNYLFVEIHPLAFVTKLQPARITPLTQGLVLILLALRVQTHASRQDWLGTGLLCLIPFSPMPGVPLLLAAILLPTAANRDRKLWPMLILALAVLLSFQPLDRSFTSSGLRYTLWAAIFGAHLLTCRLAQRPRLLAGLTAVAIGLGTVFALASQRQDWPPFLARRFSINAFPLDPPGVLGLRFGAGSAKDVVVLVPPTSEAWVFKLHARRAVVVDDKSAPFTDQGLAEWRLRMEQVLGVAPAPILDPANAWRSRSPESLQALAERYGARYILTRDIWHAVLPGRKIDHEADWSLWELPNGGNPSEQKSPNPPGSISPP